jgi:hypothetical protein
VGAWLRIIRARPKDEKGAARLRVMICDLRRYYLFPMAINMGALDVLRSELAPLAAEAERAPP